MRRLLSQRTETAVAAGTSVALRDCKRTSIYQFAYVKGLMPVQHKDGTDDHRKLYNEQQRWFLDEQWKGYSQSYLGKMPRYFDNRHLVTYRDQLHVMLWAIYELYGKAADILEELHADPLHPQFHDMLARAVEHRKKFEKHVDETYKGLHPVLKLQYDSWVVKRYYTLGDWIELVKRRRAKIFNDLTPEFVEQAQNARNLSERHMSRLRQLGREIFDNPAGYLESSGNFDKEELAVLEHKMSYYRKAKQWSNMFYHGSCFNS